MNKPIACGTCGKCFYGIFARGERKTHQETECSGESELEKALLVTAENAVDFDLYKPEVMSIKETDR